MVILREWLQLINCDQNRDERILVEYGDIVKIRFSIRKIARSNSLSLAKLLYILWLFSFSSIRS